MWDKPQPYTGPTSYDQGYPYFYAPGHPLAKKNGMVSLARHNASVQIGRWVQPQEIVIFDGNLINGKVEVITRKELIKRNNIRYGRSISFHCDHCGQERTESVSHHLRRAKHYCSPKCSQLDKRKFEVSKDALAKLVWMIPTMAVAEIFDVSDKAVEKRCKLLGVDKPPRGYWQKHAKSVWDEVIAVLIAEGITL